MPQSSFLCGKSAGTCCSALEAPVFWGCVAYCAIALHTLPTRQSDCLCSLGVYTYTDVLHADTGYHCAKGFIIAVALRLFLMRLMSDLAMQCMTDTCSDVRL